MTILIQPLKTCKAYSCPFDGASGCYLQCYYNS